jgi:hypothetical protein
MKLTSDQLSFAKGLSERQWRTLAVLAQFSSFLSASERADHELYALIRQGLAQCAPLVVGVQGCYQWFATDAGREALRLRKAGRIA